MMSNLAADRERLALLIELGRKGILWWKIGELLGVAPETARKRWYLIAEPADLIERQKRIERRRRRAEMMAYIDDQDPGMPPGTIFRDEPRAAPEYGRPPTRHTYTRYEGPSSWAVIEEDDPRILDGRVTRKQDELSSMRRHVDTRGTNDQHR